MVWAWLPDAPGERGNNSSQHAFTAERHARPEEGHPTQQHSGRMLSMTSPASPSASTSSPRFVQGARVLPIEPLVSSSSSSAPPPGGSVRCPRTYVGYRPPPQLSRSPRREPRGDALLSDRRRCCSPGRSTRLPLPIPIGAAVVPGQVPLSSSALGDPQRSPIPARVIGIRDALSLIDERAPGEPLSTRGRPHSSTSTTQPQCIEVRLASPSPPASALYSVEVSSDRGLFSWRGAAKANLDLPGQGASLTKLRSLVKSPPRAEVVAEKAPESRILVPRPFLDASPCGSQVTVENNEPEILKVAIGEQAPQAAVTASPELQLGKLRAELEAEFESRFGSLQVSVAGSPDLLRISSPGPQGGAPFCVLVEAGRDESPDLRLQSPRDEALVYVDLFGRSQARTHDSPRVRVGFGGDQFLRQQLAEREDALAKAKAERELAQEACLAQAQALEKLRRDVEASERGRTHLIQAPVPAFGELRPRGFSFETEAAADPQTPQAADPSAPSAESQVKDGSVQRLLEEFEAGVRCPDEAKLRAIFHMVDTNGDGWISRAELIRSLREQHEVRKLLSLPSIIGERERMAFESVFQRMDSDDNRKVDFNEFARYAALLSQPLDDRGNSTVSTLASTALLEAAALHDLEAQLIEQRAECSLQKQQLEKTERERLALQEALSRTQSDVAAYKAQMDFYQVRSLECQRLVEEQAERIRRLMVELDNCSCDKATIEEQQKLINRLSADLEVCTRELSLSDGMQKTLRETVEAGMREIDIFQSQSERRELSLIDQHSEHSWQLKAKFSEEAELLKAAHDRHLSEEGRCIAGLEDSLHKLTGEKEQSRALREDCLEKCIGERNQLQSLHEDSLRKLTGEKEHWQALHEEAMERLDALGAKAQEAAATHLASRTTLASELSERHATVDTLEEALASLTAEYDASRTEIKSLEESLTKLEELVSHGQQMLAYETSSHALTKQQIDTHAAVALELEKRAAEENAQFLKETTLHALTRQQIDTHVARIGKLEEQAAEENAQFLQEASSHALTRQQIDSHAARIHELERQVADANEKFIKQTSSHASSRQQIDTYLARIVELEKRVANENDRFEQEAASHALTGERVDAHLARIGELEKRVEEEKAQYVNEVLSHSSTREQLAAENAQIQTALSSHTLTKEEIVLHLKRISEMEQLLAEQNAQFLQETDAHTETRHLIDTYLARIAELETHVADENSRFEKEAASHALTGQQLEAHWARIVELEKHVEEENTQYQNEVLSHSSTREQLAAHTTRIPELEKLVAAENAQFRTALSSHTLTKQEIELHLKRITELEQLLAEQNARFLEEADAHTETRHLTDTYLARIAELDAHVADENSRFEKEAASHVLTGQKLEGHWTRIVELEKHVEEENTQYQNEVLSHSSTRGQLAAHMTRIPELEELVAAENAQFRTALSSHTLTKQEIEVHLKRTSELEQLLAEQNVRLFEEADAHTETRRRLDSHAERVSELDGHLQKAVADRNMALHSSAEMEATLRVEKEALELALNDHKDASEGVVRQLQQDVEREVVALQARLDHCERRAQNEMHQEAIRFESQVEDLSRNVEGTKAEVRLANEAREEALRAATQVQRNASVAVEAAYSRQELCEAEWKQRFEDMAKVEQEMEQCIKERDQHLEVLLRDASTAFAKADCSQENATRMWAGRVEHERMKVQQLERLLEESQRADAANGRHIQGLALPQERSSDAVRPTASRSALAFRFLPDGVIEQMDAGDPFVATIRRRIPPLQKTLNDARDTQVAWLRTEVKRVASKQERSADVNHLEDLRMERETLLFSIDQLSLVVKGLLEELEVQHQLSTKDKEEIRDRLTLSLCHIEEEVRTLRQPTCSDGLPDGFMNALAEGYKFGFASKTWENGATPMHISAQLGRNDVASYLTQEPGGKAMLAAADATGMTPAQRAAAAGRTYLAYSMQYELPFVEVTPSPKDVVHRGLPGRRSEENLVPHEQQAIALQRHSLPDVQPLGLAEYDEDDPSARRPADIEIELLPERYLKALRQVEQIGWKQVGWTRGYTLLHYAASCGFGSLAKYLVTLGADPLETDGKNHSAVDYATEHGHSALASDLMQAAAEIVRSEPLWPAERLPPTTTTTLLSPSPRGSPRGSLLLPPSSGNDSIERKLSSASKAVDPYYLKVLAQVDENGWEKMEWKKGYTLLHWAAKHDHADLVSRLLFKGADPWKVDDAGKDAFAYARDNNAADALARLSMSPPRELPPLRYSTFSSIGRLASARLLSATE